MDWTVMFSILLARRKRVRIHKANPKSKHIGENPYILLFALILLIKESYVLASL